VKIWGVTLALFAGATCGVNAVPFELWNASRDGSTSPLAFLFSQTLGVYAASSLIYHLVGAAALLSSIELPHSAVRPAYASGVMWAIGEAALLMSLDSLGMAQGYVFGAIGPVMLSAGISCVVFREIRGWRNLLGFGAALGLQIIGVVMLAVGSG